MEEIWNNVRPFSCPQKGANGCYNYGYRSKKRSYRKLNKRKVYRQIRHYGFDTSECWNLNDTIMCWLSDNVGGFFRECGKADDWDFADGDYKVNIELGNKREKSYKKHLEEYLKSLNTTEYNQFLDFVIPRLLYFQNHFTGYPVKFNSEKEWRKILDDMVSGLKEGYTEFFIEYFFNLWD